MEEFKMEFKLLSEEQLKEIEQREQQKLIQQELEQQRLREVEMKRREEERKAKECYLKQLRESHEPLISAIESLNESNYLIMQYQNPNGHVSTYRFKDSSNTKVNEFWISYDEEYNIYISNGYDRRPVIFQNILGIDVREETVAAVILVGGVVYKRMIVEPDQVDIHFTDKQVKSYKGDFHG